MPTIDGRHPLPGLRNFTLALAVAGVLLPTTVPADGIDDFNNGWTGRALAAQRRLDLRTPLGDVNILGTHNSFNAAAYSSGVSYLDPNQVDSIYNQLRMGARAVEFDVHWTAKAEGPFSFPDRLLLCHGTADHLGCTVSDRYLHEGLDEISAWLGTANSIEQVLLLHIEDHMDGHHGEAYDQIQARFGDLVFTSGGCRDLPGDLTKDVVLAAGKKILIWNEGGCSGHAGWNSMVFTGLGDLARVWEDSTVIGGLAGSGAAIGDADVANYFAGGVNLVDLDQLTQNDSRLAAAVWSWDAGEPNNIGDEDCAVQIGSGRWNDADCSSEHVFACENLATGGWATSAIAGNWGLGALACDALGPDYTFSVPTNSQDNALLRQARDGAGHSQVWLNHDDRQIEGLWISNEIDGVFYPAGGFTLGSGQSVTAHSRMLRMEPNCNLVLYSAIDGVVGGGLWTTATAGAGSDCRVEFQGDGNFVIYDGSGSAPWHSSTSGAEFWIQNDGNAVIYDGGGAPLWQTYTFYPADVVLQAGQFTLGAGEILHSRNRKLAMGEDCNLVLYAFENGVTGGVLWRSEADGGGAGCHADLQNDGNFVVYDAGGQPLWAAGTSGTVGAELRLQSDGNLVLYNGAGEPLWSAEARAADELVVSAGAFLLAAGEFIQTTTRKLEMREDCNLVVLSVANAVPGGELWRSETAGAGTGCYADFQPDGNFVVYDAFRNALWDAGTSGTTGAELRLQVDGNLVLYNGANEPLWIANTRSLAARTFYAGQFALAEGDFAQTATRKLELQPDCNLVLSLVANALPGEAIWHSDTAGAAGPCTLDFQDDGNLVLYDGFGQPLWDAGTSGTSGAELRMQDDGNVVIYNGAGQPLWSTLTPGDFSATARCADATCNGHEDCSSCAADCGACPPVCGDAACNGEETCSDCPEDCGACPSVCGDAACNGEETCSDCPEDCGACPPVCGDTACNGEETCNDCPEDCGACPPVCGDTACNGEETCSDCPEDCGACPPVCGDAACNGEETCNDCPEDCGACPPAPCPALADVDGCRVASLLKLQLDESKPGEEKLKIQWKKLDADTLGTDLGDPVDGTDAVSICLYHDDGRLMQQYTVDRAGGLCAGRPCWRAVGTRGYRYADRDFSADGIDGLGFLGGPGRAAKASASGANDAGDGRSTLPTGVVARMAGNRSPTVELLADNGFCIAAEVSLVLKDDGRRFKALKRQ
jgi:hypothetical protein